MNDEMFVLVEASKLSMDEEFMQHRPKSMKEKVFKDLLKAVIQNGIDDFYRPIMDPYFGTNGNICFEAGMKPAVGKSPNWWYENAKKYNPERKSRLGTKSQYIAFLGVLIKALVAEGWSKKDAWHAVCVNSEKLGHYSDSRDAKNKLELTGSRLIAGFYDLANTWKILEDDEKKGVLLEAGGGYIGFTFINPLAKMEPERNCNTSNCASVGWIVLEC